MNFYYIWIIARMEARLLWRSWSFRIFSLIGLTIIVFINIGLGTDVGNPPHFFRSLSGSLPLMNLKLLNIYQGIMAAFLATEFFKRDYHHDTTQVVFTRAFSNIDYMLGKLIGILSIFGLLNLMALTPAIIVHLFFSDIPFAWQPYLVYTLFISLPTLLFMVGSSILLVNLFRSQAIVFALMLGYSLLVLILLQNDLFSFFDCYAFFQPLIYSDFIGLGNLSELLLLRGMYAMLGIGFICAAALMTTRLRQSPLANIVTAVASVLFIAGATLSGVSYLSKKYADRTYRDTLIASSRALNSEPVPTMAECKLDIEPNGKIFTASARIIVVNKNDRPLDSLLFSLNPGLEVLEVKDQTDEVSFERDELLLWVKPAVALQPRDSLTLSIAYRGSIDDRACYLDIHRERFESPVRMWLFAMPKMYSILTDEYLHLTPETVWYPVAGLPPGAAFPQVTKRDFTRFELQVTVPTGLTAISQGAVTIDNESGRYRFEPEKPLSNLSLTIGEYEVRRISVDSLDYALYTLPGHDYFAPYLDRVSDTLPHIIRELRNEYEAQLELTYPFHRLSLVEVPIQFYSYRRFWTLAQEVVQPEIVYLPEMGMLCDGADFAGLKRGSRRSQERANQAESPEQIQAGYFANFVRIGLMGTRQNRRSASRGERIEPRYYIFSNYVSYSTHISSRRWPILNYGFESYFAGRVTAPADNRFRQYRGLTQTEQANLLLQKHPLSSLISDSPADVALTIVAIEAKARYLLSLLESESGSDKFGSQMNSFLQSYSFQDVPAEALFDLISEQGESDFAATMNRWYSAAELPGYLITDVESYKVRVGERTRHQVKMRIENPTGVNGMVRIGLRYRRQQVNFESWWLRGPGQDDYSKTIAMPAGSIKEVGMLADEPPRQLTIETFVSRNIPSTMSIPFRQQKLRKKTTPFDGERTITPESDSSKSITEVLVDNEDAGFTIISFTEETWLRRTLLGLFGSDDEKSKYVRLRTWDPPGNWMASTHKNFHGRFVRSAYYKKSGNGDNKVAWSVELEKPGDFDVYYYYEGNNIGGNWWRRNRDRQEDKGRRTFLVYHEDGREDLPVDLNLAEEGWNYLGTFRLSSGLARVELTDLTEKDYVIADAIKWVKRGN